MLFVKIKVSPYVTYILQCSDGTFYTGVTTELNKRLAQHNGSLPGGARYTSARRPVKFVYYEFHQNRSSAQKRESFIKKLSRQQKTELIQNQNLD